jgi:F-type H+-transporting ATPase subunit gamma
MANLKEIRTRITSVKSTRQITNAMKMVSAAKLRKAQDAVTQLRPYAIKLHQILGHLNEVSEGEIENIYSEVRSPEKILIVLISSNRGLCGPFNANISKKTIDIIETKYKRQFLAGNVKFATIGKKAGDVLKSKGYTIYEKFDKIYDELNFANTSIISENLMNKFSTGEFDCVDLVYNKFKNAAVQIITEEQLLPVIQDESEKTLNEDYIFEPSLEFIVENVIPESIKISLHAAILDSNAAEQGARMTAMHKATDNATDLIKELTLSYNKARQAAITGEIMEITAGAEALKG